MEGYSNDGEYVSGFVRKINRKQVNMGIIGLGYVGLPLAREFLKFDKKSN